MHTLSGIFYSANTVLCAVFCGAVGTSGSGLRPRLYSLGQNMAYNVSSAYAVKKANAHLTMEHLTKAGGRKLTK